MSQVQAAIKGHLYDWDTYAGKTCTLRVKIAEDGTLLSVAQEGGDPAFVRRC
jgi:colicin import membrane protein